MIRYMGSVKKAVLYPATENTLAPSTSFPSHPISRNLPVKGSESAPRSASNAFINPIAVAARMGKLISQIIVKQSRKLLIENPKINSKKASIYAEMPGA
jgi:hypothetical protein